MLEIEQLSTKLSIKINWMRVRENQIKCLSRAKGIYGVVDKPYFVVIVPY